MGPWWPLPSRKSSCKAPHPKSESHCQMWVVFGSSETGMRAVGQWGWEAGRVCPVALQLALCMPSPLRKEGTRATFHSSHSKKVASCCVASGISASGDISSPYPQPPYMLSLWGAPEKTIRKQVCMRSHPTCSPRLLTIHLVAYFYVSLSSQSS